MIELRKAVAGDGVRIASTRQKVWDATYRGIYPDEMIDQFSLDWHAARDEKRIADKDVQSYLVLDGDSCVGYYVFGDVTHSGEFWLMSLYLLPQYQGRGLGKRIMQVIADYARNQGCRNMFLYCDPQNTNALGFYAHLGGKVVAEDIGHENAYEDSLTMQFDFL